MIKFICYCKNWNYWRTHNRNNILHKICVFFYPRKSATFMLTKEYVILDGKIVTWNEAWVNGVLEGLKVND